MTLTEYTGQLFGGPDDGNILTTSVEVVPAVSTVMMWLDGEDKDATIVITKGQYVWDSRKHYFIWKLESSTLTKVE